MSADSPPPNASSANSETSHPKAAHSKAAQKPLSPEQKRARKRRLIFSAVTAAVLLILTVVSAFVPYYRLLPPKRLPEREENALRLHFLDVGQGNCTVIEFPEGDILIVDAGDGSFRVKNDIIRYIKGIGPSSVSMLLSHPDLDHYGGFRYLIDVFETEKFYLPALGSDEGEYRTFLSTLARENCPTETVRRYLHIRHSSGAEVVLLNPYSAGETDDNDSSAVLYVAYGGVRALLTGDISETREKKLVSEYEIDHTLFDAGDCSVRLEEIDILELAHHGGNGASCAEWLGLLEPSACIVSCGRGNRYGHPASETLERVRAASPDCEIYRTDESGSLIVSIHDGSYTVSTVKGVRL